MPLISYLIYLFRSNASKPAPNHIISQSHVPGVGYHIFFIILVFSIILSFFILQSAFLLLSAMTILTMLPLFNAIPYRSSLKSFANNVLESTLFFFYTTGFLRFLYIIYIFWVQCLTIKGFKMMYSILLSFNLGYIILIRYIFYLKLYHENLSFSIYLGYFILLVFVIFRYLTDASFFLIKLICDKYVNYKEILLTEMPEELPESSTTSRSSNPRWGGIFNFHFHKHKHMYPPQPPISNFAYYGKIAFAITGLAFTAFAGYNYHRTADAAVRSADAAEVQAGLMSKEEFKKRHPSEGFFLFIMITIRHRLHSFSHMFNRRFFISCVSYILIFSFLIFYIKPLAACVEIDTSSKLLNDFLLRGHANRIEILREVVKQSTSVDELLYLSSVINECIPTDNYYQANPFVNDTVSSLPHHIMSPSNFFKTIILFIFLSFLGLLFLKIPFFFFPLPLYQQHLLYLLSVIEKDPSRYMEALSSCYQNLIDSGFFDNI